MKKLILIIGLIATGCPQIPNSNTVTETPEIPGCREIIDACFSEIEESDTGSNYLNAIAACVERHQGGDCVELFSTFVDSL